MRHLLKLIKSGRYANIVQFDKNGNLYMRQLRWNETRHKFFICDDKRGLHRHTIGKKEAIDLLTKTLYLKEQI